MRALTIMGGSADEYLGRVDEIMDFVVNEVDGKTRHPDVCIQDYMHKYGNRFILGSPSAGPGAAAKGGPSAGSSKSSDTGGER